MNYTNIYICVFPSPILFKSLGVERDLVAAYLGAAAAQFATVKCDIVVNVLSLHLSRAKIFTHLPALAPALVPGLHRHS
jgi:hypothetical protein